MYKVILADDKIQEREYLRKFIEDNFSWDLKILSVAHDGEEVLSMIRQEEPDLLLLDIQMPKVDGLEVAAQVSRTHPHIKVVLITAFAEFSYAKQAIKLGVSDYLLKPYTDGELKEVIDQVILSLDQSKNQMKEKTMGPKAVRVEDLEEKSIITKILQKNVDSRFFEKHLMGLFSKGLRYKCVVLFEEHMLWQDVETMDVVRGFFKKNDLTVIADFEVKEKNHGPKAVRVEDLEEKSIITKILQKNVDSRFFEKHLMGLFSKGLRYKCVVLFEEHMLWQDVETMDVVRGFFKKNDLTVIADFEGKEKILFLFGEKTQSFNELDQSIKRTRKFFLDGFQEEVYVGVSGFYEKLSDLTHAYSDAVSFITDFGHPKVKLSFEENRKYELALIHSEANIKLHVMNKHEKEAFEGLSFYIDEVLSRRTVSFMERRLAYLSYGIIRSVYDVLGKEDDGRERILFFLGSENLRSGSLDKEREETINLIRELIESLGEISVYNNVTLVKDAKAYILNNFREKITLADVAEAVGISYGHLSKCFRQVEGNSFNSYLMDIRIEEAKRLMREGNHPISEIAYLTGIGDPNYFSKCFKKQTGLSPKEYVTMTIAESMK